MAFYVNPIEIQRTLLQDKPVRSPESLLRVFAPGETVSIEVGDSLPDGLMQVMIGGNSYSAELPKGVSKGQLLTAEVINNADALVLKLLLGDESLPESLPPVVSLLKNLIPKDKIDLLRTLSSGVKEEIQLPTPDQEQPNTSLKVTTNAPRAGGEDFFFMPLEEEVETNPAVSSGTLAKSSTAPIPKNPVTKEVLKVIEDLITRKNIVLSEGNLATADGIESSLSEASLKNTIFKVDEAVKEVTKLTKDLPSPRLLRVLDSLETSLMHALDSETPLTFDEGEPVLPPAVRLYLEATGHSADTEGLKKLISAVSAEVKEENPLPLLVRALRLVELPVTNETTEGERALVVFLKKISDELEDIRQNAHSDPEIREGLKKIKKAVRQEVEKHIDTREVEAARSQSQAVKLVEQFVRGQEILQNVNPVVKLFGEPAVFLFPMVVHGFLSKLELVISPPVEEEDKKKKGARSEGYERADIHLDLPSLGGVNVSLAHRKGEVFINVTVSKEEIASFLENKGEVLLARFRENGVKNPVLRVSSGEPKSIVPDWYRDLTRKSVVA